MRSRMSLPKTAFITRRTGAVETRFCPFRCTLTHVATNRALKVPTDAAAQQDRSGKIASAGNHQTHLLLALVHHRHEHESEDGCRLHVVDTTIQRTVKGQPLRVRHGQNLVLQLGNGNRRQLQSRLVLIRLLRAKLPITRSPQQNCIVVHQLLAVRVGHHRQFGYGANELVRRRQLGVRARRTYSSHIRTRVP